MTEEDLRRIERALAIELPESYRAAMVDFPVPALAGNTDTQLWDDADEIISLNEDLRRGTAGIVEPWPSHLFATGHPGDASPIAIDLRSADGAMWWVEKGHLDGKGSGEIHASFEGWLASYIADLRNDCEADGIDPDGPAGTAGTGCLAFVLVVAGGVAFAFAARLA